jgi:hypothetical protein
MPDEYRPVPRRWARRSRLGVRQRPHRFEGKNNDPPFERRPYPRQRGRLGPAHRSGHPLGPPATGPDIDSGVIQ